MFGLKPLLGLEPMTPIRPQLLVNHANHSATYVLFVYMYVCMYVYMYVCLYVCVYIFFFLIYFLFIVFLNSGCVV